MKKFITFFAFASIVLASSCQKETFETSNNGFSASFETSSKVTIDNSWNLSWESGDQILTNEGTTSVVLTATKSGSTTYFTAESFEIDPAKTYNAVYPAEGTSFDSGTSLVVASSAVPVAGKFPAAPAVAVTSGTDKSFSFKNICGLVSFTISESDIASVTIYGKNLAENVAGKVSVDCSEASYSVIEGEKYITLKADKTTAGAFATGRYYVAVLPQAFNDGMSITLHKLDGSKIRRNYNAFTLERSQHIDLNELASGATFKSEFTIKNAAELQAFLSIADSCGTSTVATLANDIDLSGFTLTPAANFNGTFDGGGYKLKNWTSSTTLFTQADTMAVIKNLILDESCNFSITTGDARPSFIVRYNKGTVSSCKNYASISYSESSPKNINFGTIVSYNEGLVEKCENYGNLTIAVGEGTGTVSQRYGGVVGAYRRKDNGTAVSECTNHGTISFTCNSAASKGCNIVVGGVVAIGATNTNPVIKDYVSLGKVYKCVNDAPVSVSVTNGTKVNHINAGGVLGYTEGCLESCSNSGAVGVNVTAGASTSGRPAVGGVAGLAVFGAKSCTNSGKVTVSGTFSSITSASSFSAANILPSVGGVCGYAGTGSGSTSVLVESCTNTGEVDVTFDMDSSKKVESNAAGVVGNSTAYVNTCTNDENGKVDVKSQSASTNVGGVVGKCSINLYKGINKAPVALDLQITTANGNKSTSATIGGVAGFVDKSSNNIIKCNQNYGTVTMNNGVYASGKISYVGGVVGRTTSNNMNSTDDDSNINDAKGSITVSSPLSVYVGGILGRYNQLNAGTNAMQFVKNYANITVTDPGEGSCVGGVAGYHGNGTIGKNAFCGKGGGYVTIKVVNTDKKTLYVGGLVGRIVTDGSPDAPKTSIAFGGTSERVIIDATDATGVGLLTGGIQFTSDDATNGIGYGNIETPKTSTTQYIGTSCVLNGKTINIDGKTSSDFLESDFFGVITPSTTTTKEVDEQPVAGKHYYYYIKTSKVEWTNYMSGLTKI